MDEATKKKWLDRLSRWGAMLLGVVMVVVALFWQATLYSIWILDRIESTWDCKGVYDGVRPVLDEINNGGWFILTYALFLNYWPVIGNVPGTTATQVIFSVLFLLLHCIGLGILCVRTNQRPSRVACIGWGMLIGSCLSLGVGFAFMYTPVVGNVVVMWLHYILLMWPSDLVVIFIGILAGVLLAFRKKLTGRALIWLQLTFLSVFEVLILYILMEREALGALMRLPEWPTTVLGQMLILCILANIGALVGSYRRHVRLMREKANEPVCIWCGYDMRGITEKCPECGAVATLSTDIRV